MLASIESMVSVSYAYGDQPCFETREEKNEF